MSAYDDALKAIEQARGSFVEQHILRFLAALPPSIVVDGRVVELEEVWVADVLNADGYDSEPVWALVRAAREVAE